MAGSPTHLTRAWIHLDRLTHNVRLLQGVVGGRPLWPCIKANGYGHGMTLVAKHLVEIGCSTLCVAHITEALELREAGIEATLLLLSATLPEHAEAIVASRSEPVVCTTEMLEALSREGEKQKRTVSLHLKVDTGMGRIGVQPGEVPAFLDRCEAFPRLRVCGLMSHFSRADEAGKKPSHQQIECFRKVAEKSKSHGIKFRHLANSAAILDLPDSHFDATRPGIAIYGLRPSPEVVNRQVNDLQPVLELKTHVTFLKEVPAGTGLSYGHTFYTGRPSLIATIPAGYGDGLRRNLSNRCHVLVGGVRCPQVGTITMDQSLIDVTALRRRIGPGDEVVLIGRQGKEEITADLWAETLQTINYEVTTGIADRVPRIVAGSD